MNHRRTIEELSFDELVDLVMALNLLKERAEARLMAKRTQNRTAPDSHLQTVIERTEKRLHHCLASVT